MTTSISAKAETAAAEAVLLAARQAVLDRARRAASWVTARQEALSTAQAQLQALSAAGIPTHDYRCKDAQERVSAATTDEARSTTEAQQATAEALQAETWDLPILLRATVAIASSEDKEPAATAHIIARAFFGPAEQAAEFLQALGADVSGGISAARSSLLSALRSRFDLDTPSLEERCETLEAQVRELAAVVQQLQAADAARQAVFDEWQDDQHRQAAAMQEHFEQALSGCGRLGLDPATTTPLELYQALAAEAQGSPFDHISERIAKGEPK